MKKLIILSVLLLAVLPGFAHTINYTLDKMDDSQVIWEYLLTGFDHIIPYGLDHILFILCIFFLNTNVKQIVLQASMFTLAHSITLGLAMYGVINPPGDVIEPLIAFSIVLLALENVFFDKVKPWRMIMVFLFGLVHGMGFAGALSELGMPPYAFAAALISFNVGVELGQLTVILVMYLLVARMFAQKSWYRKRIVIPSAVAIAFVASYWTVERIFFA